MAKCISVLLTLFLVFFCMPTVALAADELIENGSFESDILAWSNGSLTDNEPRFGMHCLSFSNPSQSENGYIHSTTYLSTVFLTANTVYSLKFYIRGESAESFQLLPEGTIDLSNSTGTFTMHVSSVTNTWQPVAVCFTADNTGTFSFILEVEHTDANAIIFVDDIKFLPINFTPVGLAIQGRRSVTIPDMGEIYEDYTAVVTDAEGNYVVNRNASITVMDSLPSGVRFDETQGRLYVSADTPDNGTITLLCTPTAASASFLPASITVRLSHNMIINGDMEDIPPYSGWNTDEAPFSLTQDRNNNVCAKVPCFSDVDGAYYGTIIPAPTFLMQESVMYVFRGKVRADISDGTGKTEANIFAMSDNGTISIKISNLREEWSDIIAAFRVPVYGFYTLRFEFLASNGQYIYFDDVEIKPESPSPSGIYFDAPSHIAIPAEGKIEYPISYVVYDQEGQFLDHAVDFTISPEDGGVTISNGKISVLSSATPQSYIITAATQNAPLVQSHRTIEISNESVGDGSFENTSPGQIWATASPSLLHFVSTEDGTQASDGVRFARLTMNGAVSALLSDSIYRYDAGDSYVFEADFRAIVPDIQTVVTVMVDNALSDSFDDNLVVGQFFISEQMKKIQKLFTPSASVTGRLMIAFNTPETHDQQVVLLDNVSVTMAEVRASSVSIGGLPYLDRNIVGKYRFSSNFAAVDSSTCRWLFSNDANGIFMPIEGQNGTTLSITSDMLGKFVKFEVTPISLSGPVVGESVISSAVLIGEPIPSDTSSAEDTTEDPVSPPDEIISTDEPASVSRGGMQVLDIRKFSVNKEHSFFDTSQHWAKKEIELLTAAGIVQGRGLGLFEPETFITRAEFSAILARAFELAPIYYEGQFTDVKSHSWYAGAVAVVTKHGIAQGTSEKTFSPDLPIRREEMATMIMRAYIKTGAQINGSNLGYTDVSEISSWAVSEVGEANALGLLAGLPDGSFQPKRNATRAEATVTIKRMISILLEMNQRIA